MDNKSYSINIKKFYLFKFLVGFLLLAGISVPFFQDWGRLSFYQVMILQSCYMLFIVIFEIPTGAVADFLGRKYSLILGCGLNVIAILVYTSVPNFYIFLLGEFLWAISASLISGADQAFIYDILKDAGKEEQSKKILGRAEIFFLAGIMIGSPLGSILAGWFGPRLPTLLNAIPIGLAMILAMGFREPEIKQVDEGKKYVRVLLGGIKIFYSNKILKILALDMIFINIIGYFMFWMFQLMLQQAGVGIKYFGFVHLMFVFAQILIINNFELLERAVGSKKNYIFLSALIAGIMYVIGGLTTFIPIVLMVIVIGGGVAVSRRTLLANYMNKYIPSPERATVLSTVSMINSIALVVINPLFGLMVEWSLNYTLIISGVSAIIFSIISKVEEEHLID